MRFFYTIGYSIFNPTFYRTLPKTPLWKALLYFFILIFLLTFIRIAVYAYSYIPEVNMMIEESVAYIDNQYPDDLEITIENGMVSTNLDAPYFFQMPGAIEEDYDFDYLLMIDTETPFTLEDFEEYRTAAWLTKDAIYTIDENEGVSMRSLANIEYMYIDKSIINRYIDQYSGWFPFIAPMLLLFLFLLYVAIESFTLVYLLLLSIVLLLAVRLAGIPLKYVDIYKISIYASTLGLIVKHMIEITPLLSGLNEVRFVFTIITLFVFTFNILYQRKVWIAQQQVNASQPMQ